MVAKQNISLKVACGYILLITLLISAIYYIYNLSLTQTQGAEAQKSLSQRRATTDILISRLLHAETLGQTASLGKGEAYPAYSLAIDEVLETANQLSEIATDSTQIARIDTLCALITAKRENVKTLAAIISKDNHIAQYYAQIERLIQENDSLYNRSQTVQQIINLETEYLINTSERNLFKRIGDVFKPNDNDTVKINRHSSIVSSDTITTFINIGDSIADKFNSINSQAMQSQTQRLKQIGAQVEFLRYAGAELSLKVSQLITDIGNEERESILSRTAKEAEIQSEAASTNAIIAIIAVILATIFFILTWRDVSRANHYRRQLEEAKDHAEELLRLREKLMLTITHDIKAPIGSVIGYIELLKETENKSTINEYLKNITNSSTHLLDLVNSLLDFHRLEVGKLDLSYSDFRPCDLIDSTVTSFKPAAAKRGLNLRYSDNTPENNDIYSGDTFRIRQILENLIGNAIKFTDTGEVEVASEINNDTLYIGIRDTGRGMTTDEQASAFQEFTRLDNAAGKEGVGLGLSITTRLVSLLGGTIELDSTPGKGSTFYISIPLLKSAATETATHPEQTASTPKPIPSYSSQQLHILIIDDDRLQLQLTKAMLLNINEHTEITTCFNPTDAVEIISKHTFNIIFTDIQMPGIDGIELGRLLKQLSPGTPIIAITARDDMNERYFIANGFATVIHKPYSISDLSLALNKILNLKKPELSQLTKFAEGAPEAEREILDTFLNETVITLDLFTKATVKKNKQEVCRLAHKMLPTMTIINANALDEIKRLNSLRDETEWNRDDDNLTNEVISSLNNVITALKKE